MLEYRRSSIRIEKIMFLLKNNKKIHTQLINLSFSDKKNNIFCLYNYYFQTLLFENISEFLDKNELEAVNFEKFKNIYRYQKPEKIFKKISWPENTIFGLEEFVYLFWIKPKNENKCCFIHSLEQIRRKLENSEDKLLSFMSSKHPYSRRKIKSIEKKILLYSHVYNISIVKLIEYVFLRECFVNYYIENNSMGSSIINNIDFILKFDQSLFLLSDQIELFRMSYSSVFNSFHLIKNKF